VALLNHEGTDGFKQHILREEDGAKPTRIVIKGSEIEFDSKSGKSTTGFRKIGAK
jgi:Up-Regulated in long-lived daf-2